jgi:hypothetical protein
MGYPEPDRDESIILEAKNVKFKSISFDARLTSRRIILVDSKKNIIPPQEILLATIWKVEAGENAIRDHLLTLTIVNNAGEKDQIVLTFPRLAGAERKRECIDWAKKLHSLIQPIPSEPKHTGRAEAEHVPEEKVKTTVQRETAGRHPLKKKIEVARPLSKIPEPAPDKVVPVETSSLPSGIFCSRCGNRVPQESTFCNHCGTPIKQSTEPGPAKQAEVPQVQILVPPQAGSPPDHQDRPIEQIIHSIEPLIEDSVPRTQPTPLVKRRVPQIVSEPVPPESPPETVTPEPTVPPESPAEAVPVVEWPVLQPSDSPLATVEEPVPEMTDSPPPAPPSAPASKLPSNLAIAVLVIVVLAFIAGLIIAANLPAGQPVTGVNVTPTKITQVTTTVKPVPTQIQTRMTTAVSAGPTLIPVPSTGVWVRVIYPGTFTGMVGTPGNPKEVTDSGVHVYSITTTDGIVEVSLQKNEGTADKLLVEVFKNGIMVKNSSTTTPKGIVEIQFDLKSLQSGNANATPEL